MRILDLFCGAGGAAMGYHRAFPDADIMGVDVKGQKNYPFFFKKADAFDERLTGYDVIHASPPCNEHSPLKNYGTDRNPGRTAWMLAAIVEKLAETDAVWVVENVGQANMPASPHSLMLCGSMFGLDVRRHRKFALSHPVPQPVCDHASQLPRFPSINYWTRMSGRLSPIVGVHGKIQYEGELEVRQKAMDIDWMTAPELSLAIPPAYTHYIGHHLKGLLA